MVTLTTYEGLPHHNRLAEIDTWFYAERKACDLAAEPLAALERLARDYYYKISALVEPAFTFLRDCLPATLQERLIEDQRAWLAQKKARFAALNLLYGLFGGGPMPFDRVGLITAHTDVVRARVADLEAFYRQFRMTWRAARLSVVCST
jgi:hypothetical protein